MSFSAIPLRDSSTRAVTNSAGSYHLTNIPPGPGYRLVISSSGFSPYEVDNVYVNVANTATQNATLTPGEHVEITVNAQGQGVTLNTEDASIGNNIEVSKLNELPVQSRLNPTVLFTLQPGITLDGAATGGRIDQDNVTVDGLDVNDFGTGNFGSITTNAPVDSVQEFRGTTGGFTPNSGPGGGGQFQLVTEAAAMHGMVRPICTTATIPPRRTTGSTMRWVSVLPSWCKTSSAVPSAAPSSVTRPSFFFDYTNSRIAESTSILRTVPLPPIRREMSLTSTTTRDAISTSRQNTTPNCISFSSLPHRSRPSTRLASAKAPRSLSF